MTKFNQEFLWFVSHPLRPETGETIKSNALKAGQYIRVLEKAGIYTNANYIGTILADVLDDRSKEERDRGMNGDLVNLAHGNGNILVGCRMSSGVRGESEFACSLNYPVYNLIGLSLDEVYDAALLLKKYEVDAVQLSGVFGPEVFKW